LNSTAFILAGGRSTRMGADKAMLELGSDKLLERAIRVCKRACSTVALIGEKKRLRPFGWVIEDVFRGQGPLAGIHAALSSKAASEFNLFLAVDMPSVTTDLLRFLVHTAEESNAVVIVPRVEDHLQTLCAIYRPGFRRVAEEALLAGHNKIDPLFHQVRTRIVEQSELKSLGFSAELFDNVNTPDEFKKIQRKLGATHR